MLKFKLITAVVRALGSVAAATKKDSGQGMVLRRAPKNSE